MNYIITEEQFKILISEEKSDGLSGDLKNMKSFVVDVVNKVKTTYGINVKFLLTWGTSIGGLVVPLDNYLRNGDFDLTDEQISLVLVGTIMMILYNSKKSLLEIINVIKDEGLTDVLSASISKCEKLKDSFVSFMESLNLTLGSTGEMISYAFLIPIVPDIVSIASQTGNIWSASEMIAERLVASGVVVLSTKVLTEILSKIIKRVRN
jgi:hypothetical protein